MKLAALLLASTAAVTSATTCDGSIFTGLFGLIAKTEFKGCVADTGYALTSLTVPGETTIAKICKSTSCKQLVADLDDLLTAHCSIGSTNILSHIVDPITSTCGWSSSSSSGSSTSPSSSSSGSSSTNTSTSSPLPIFFFHGLTRTAADADGLKAALASQGREVYALSFASGLNSTLPLNTQVPLAIEQIRSVVASDERFQNGYVFVGHSQGGMLARSVVEEMDDHKVHTLISLAGVQNGLFYGPQADDAVPLQMLLSLFGPGTMPGLLNYTSYSADPSTWNGQLQQDFAIAVTEHPELQNETSFVNLVRVPTLSDFLSTNNFLPKINNVNKATTTQDVADQLRRKANFLKLKDAHFMISPDDGAVSPYQISIFGHYSEIDSLENIEAKFQDFKVIDMVNTTEYIEDTFGLKTLDQRGGLHRLVVPNVPHSAWYADSASILNSSQIIEYQTVFDNYISPALP